MITNYYYYIIIPIVLIFLSFVIFCYYKEAELVYTEEETIPLVYYDVEADNFTDVNPLHSPKKERKKSLIPKNTKGNKSVFSEKNPMHS